MWHIFVSSSTVRMCGAAIFLGDSLVTTFLRNFKLFPTRLNFKLYPTLIAFSSYLLLSCDMQGF